MVSRVNDERSWALVEIAKAWRERCRFLERRIDALEQQITADPDDLTDTLLAEVQRLREFAERTLVD